MKWRINTVAVFIKHIIKKRKEKLKLKKINTEMSQIRLFFDETW